MNILSLSPHPDDQEFGAAGTLIKYAGAGHNVYLMVMTEGGMGGVTETRKKEQEASARVIGAKKVFWGGFEDTKLPTNSDSIKVIEQVLAEVEPNIIFAPFHEDTHQDHRSLATITMSAARNHHNLMFFETPTTSPRFRPNVFTDVTDVLDRKMKSLEAHHSQMLKTNIADTNILDMAAASATFRGVQARVTAAEGFMSIRYLLDPKRGIVA